VSGSWLLYRILSGLSLSVKEDLYRECEELANAWNLLDPLANGDLPVEDPKFLSNRRS
jgi:hypothetical protein